MSRSVPRSRDDDYTRDWAEARRHFVEEETGAKFEHLGQYSFDPAALPGNIENFSGVAQVPIGFAGPLLINGEHAQGEFYVPLATTEGTLVASYNRGMRAVRAAGGVRATVVDDRMQRSPVFLFENALEAKRFGEWVRENSAEIKRQADATSSVGRLIEIEHYQASRMMYLRFDYTTGDAAGQNMVGKATRAACEWIADRYPKLRRYRLDGNFATDKKHSHLNTLRTRGKKVIAEAVLPDAVIRELLHTTAEDLVEARMLANVGSLMSLAINNGAHSANAITAIFIATGQDVACVAESSAAIAHSHLTPEGDFYYSITIPSLVVATYGGGTGLPTQRECLEMLGCYGEGKVRKLAEIVAGTVLAGELSLGAAIVSDTWVASHERHGRNR